MKTLKDLINKSNTVKEIFANNGINLSKHCLVKVNGSGMSIELTSDKFTKRVFGSCVDVFAHRDFSTGKRNVTLNVGSLGSFTPDCAASMFKIKTQFSIVSEWGNFVAVATALINEVEAQNQLQMLTSKK